MHRYTLAVGDRTFGYNDPGDVPLDVAVRMGRVLGISPVTYLGPTPGWPTPDPVDQFAPLVDAAGILGYRGVDAASLATLLGDRVSSAQTLVALVPDPTAHKSSPPGRRWICHSEPFDPPSSGPRRRDDVPALIRATVAMERLNETSPVSSLLLWDDPTAEMAHRDAVGQGFDAAVLLNRSGRVATLDAGTLVVTPSDGTDVGKSVTPPLADGARDTAWRRELIRRGDVVEKSLEPDDLYAANRIVCMYPWGDRVPVELA